MILLSFVGIHYRDHRKIYSSTAHFWWIPSRCSARRRNDGDTTLYEDHQIKKWTPCLRIWNISGVFNHAYCWWKKSCTSWYGKYQNYLQGFIHHRWLFGMSQPSRVLGELLVSGRVRFDHGISVTWHVVLLVRDTFLPMTRHKQIDKQKLPPSFN